MQPSNEGRWKEGRGRSHRSHSKGNNVMHLAFQCGEKHRAEKFRVILFFLNWGGLGGRKQWCTILDIPIRQNNRAAAHRRPHGRHLSLCVRESLLLSLRTCCPQITAQMSSSLIVVCWPAEKTEMLTRLCWLDWILGFSTKKNSENSQIRNFRLPTLLRSCCRVTRKRNNMDTRKNAVLYAAN